MQDESKERWEWLREQAAVERDPQEIAKLMEEIIQLLAEKLMQNTRS